MEMTIGDIVNLPNQRRNVSSGWMIVVSEPLNLKSHAAARAA
ncbi:hypothetical protein [Croceicoccus bisphenolivorans]|nr:hypothetical protein [Croceicoccus bisphenolivorans]